MKPIIIPSPQRERWLTQHVPYRISILRGLTVCDEQGGPKGLFRPVFPCIFEASLIVCRWTANFFGLHVHKGTLKLVHERKKTTDVFAIDVGGFLVDPNSLQPEQQKLLTSVLLGANVASAHPTREEIGLMDWEDVKPASVLLIEKTRKHLYDPLGMDLPE